MSQWNWQTRHVVEGRKYTQATQGDIILTAVEWPSGIKWAVFRRDEDVEIVYNTPAPTLEDAQRAAEAWANTNLTF